MKPFKIRKWIFFYYLLFYCKGVYGLIFSTDACIQSIRDFTFNHTSKLIFMTEHSSDLNLFWEENFRNEGWTGQTSPGNYDACLNLGKGIRFPNCFGGMNFFLF